MQRSRASIRALADLLAALTAAEVALARLIDREETALQRGRETEATALRGEISERVVDYVASATAARVAMAFVDGDGSELAERFSAHQATFTAFLRARVPRLNEARRSAPDLARTDYRVAA